MDAVEEQPSLTGEEFRSPLIITRERRLVLRDYQVGAINRVKAMFAEGFRRLLGVMSMGGGKSIVFAKLAEDEVKENGNRTLILVDQDELVYQAVERIQETTGIKADIEKAEQRASRLASVVVSTVQSMSRRLDKWPRDHFGLVVADECDKSMAEKTWMPTLRHFDEHAKIFGCSATPNRADRKDIMTYYEAKAFDIGLFDLIRAGWLSRITVRTVPLKIDIRDVRQRKGDYDAEQLSEKLIPYFKEICNAIKEYASDRKVLIFWPLIHTSEQFVQVAIDEGLNFRHIDGKSPDRRQIQQAFRDGQFQGLSNAQLMGRGIDMPFVDAIINCRVTRHPSTFRQIIGRGVRTFEGKRDCIAEGTLILTDQGEIPIEKVTKSMRVWDGTCFAEHDGAIYKGEQETITHAGLTATPNHQVWTKTGWQLFSSCAAEQIAISVTGIDGSPIRESEGCFSRVEESWDDAENVHGMYKMRQAEMVLPPVSSTRGCGVPEMWQRQPSSQMADSTNGISEGSLCKSEKQYFREIRRKRNRISFRWPISSSNMDKRQSWNVQGKADRPNSKRWTLRDGEYALVNASTESITHKEKSNCTEISRIQETTSGDKICRFNLKRNAVKGYDGQTNCRAMAPPIQQAKRRVWDILNCGRFHRFTANGLLVHNCLILDFLWQFERFGIMRPSDLIAKSPQIAKRITEKLEEPGERDLEAADAESAAEYEQRLMEEFARKRKKRGTVFDALEWAATMDIRSLVDYSPETQRDLSPVTEYQARRLEKAGFLLESVSGYGHAERIVEVMNQRITEKLASFKQVFWLRRFGHADAMNVGFEEASRLLDRYFQR